MYVIRKEKSSRDHLSVPIFYIFLREKAFLPLALLTTAVLVSSSISVAETSLDTDTKKIEEREEKKKRPTSHQPEYVTVNSHMTADGTTGNPVGAGLMPKQTIAKSQSGLTRDFIARQSPTQSSTSLISMLPGVVYSANDPLGTNDDQQGLSVRGLDQTEIGYLFEGIPAAPPLFLMPYTSASVDNENIRSVTLTQGSADSASPVYNAVGGQLSVQLAKPKKAAGGFLDLSYGSYALNREFIRLDSGELGHSGVTSFVSFSYRNANQWRGAGNSPRFHVDSRIVKEWGNQNTASFIATFNRQRQYYLRAPNMSQWQTYGTKFNYSEYYKEGDANYYLFQENARSQIFLSSPLDLSLNHNLQLSLKPYFIYVSGYDGFGTNLSAEGSYQGNQPAGPLQASSAANGSITAVATDTYKQAHSGVSASVSWKTKKNTLTGGIWYSYYDFSNPSRYVAASEEGNVSNMKGYYPILTASNEPLSSYNSHLVQQTNALYIQDSLRLFSDKLMISGAFRAIMVSREVSNLLPGARYKNGASYFSPQPQIALSYQITKNHQIFINATTGFRAPSGISNYNDRFSISSGKQTRNATSDTKPEYSIGEEIGYRYSGAVRLSLSAFNYNFTNRQINTTTSLNGALVSESINGGGQTARGLQGEIGTPKWHNLSAYASGQYIHATIDNNLKSGIDYLPTKGKKAIRTPSLSGSLGLSYDDGNLFGMVSVNYVGPTYSTFMNDERLASFTTTNITIGYRLKKISFAKTPQIQLNLLNLGQSGYLSGVNSVSFNAKSAKGVFGTAITGKAPTYFVGGGFAGVVSLSTGF